MIHQYLKEFHYAKSQEINQIMHKIVKLLMREYHIKISDEYYDITEIEFYYFNAHTHKDPFVHLNCLQLDFFKWYVHEKSIKRGGVDLTFGDGLNFGGILLRELRNQKNNDFITGPANVRQRITNLLNLPNTKHQTLQKTLQEPNKMTLIQKQKKEIEIYYGKRIGLSNKSICNAEKFIEAPYRFISFRDDKRINNNNKSYSVVNILNLRLLE